MSPATPTPPNFPTAGALQATKGGEPDAFVAKVDPAGGALVYSTYFGGSGADGANGIVVDRTGSAHVVGTTGSTNWVTAKPTQAAKSGGDDAFVLRLDSTGRGPLFSSFVGGRDAEAGMGLALDSQGAVHLLGLTGSADFPSIKPVTGSRPAAGGDAFVATLSLVDAAAPSSTVAGVDAAAPAASSGGTSAHDRRVRILFGLTLALLLVAVAQTVFLRRRTPALGKPASGRRPVPAPSGPRGLHALDDMPAKAGAKKAGASAKAPLPPRSSRTPKTRGGPKGGPPKGGGPKKAPAAAQKSADDQKAAVAKDEPTVVGVPVEASVTATDAPTTVESLDDGGPPTVVTPVPPPTPRRPQNPAVAQLLEEDLWAPEPGERAERGVDDDDSAEAAAPAEAAPEWAPFDTGSTPVVGSGPMPAPEPGVPIPPVPAEELSFWDLFPEDLPPARATSFPAEDLLAGDSLALPEGPDSAAGRLVGSPPAEAEAEVDAPAPPPAERPPRPPEAEIVIAELLDGPVPTGTRPSAESVWAPSPADDFRVDELLADRGSPAAPPPAPAAPAGEVPADDDAAPAASGQSSGQPSGQPSAQTSAQNQDQQARIAADRARRRRSRRGGGRPSG